MGTIKKESNFGDKIWDFQDMGIEKLVLEIKLGLKLGGVCVKSVLVYEIEDGDECV